MTIKARDVAARLPVGRKQLTWLAYYTRRNISRVDNAEVRLGRQLLRVMRTAPPDLLYLGDSALSFVSAADSDTRRLYAMVADQVSPASMHVAHGGSFHPALYDAYLRLLTGTPNRPLVIVPLCIRVRTLPWIEHPIFGHKQATSFLSAADPLGAAWRVRSGFPRPTAEQFARFHKLPHHTWAGDLTVGDYITRLKNPKAAGLDADAAMTLLYAYHHGGTVQGGQHLDAVVQLGKRLRELGCRTVVYQTPVPVQKGRELHGPAFGELAARNFAQLDDAYRTGYGEGAEILQTGMDFATSEFIDPRDGSEHLNQTGRLHLATAISNAISIQLNAPRQP